MSIYSFIKKNNGIPLYVQVKQAFINDINTGKLENMQKLPSRRNLAKDLNLSTTTINNAYQALVDEGYVITIDRSGFYVKSNDIQYGEYDDVPWESNTDYTYNFSYNNCEISNLDDTYSKMLTKYIQANDFSSFYMHGNKRGELEFRSAISRFLYNRRNIDCSVSDIFLGAGIQYLLTVVVMILGTDIVYGFENPTDYKMFIWLKNLGLDIRLVDIDLDNGFKCDKLDELGIDVMFVMPENQLPTGHCMSKKQRRELAQWCSGKNSSKYVIEVATDGNLNYTNNTPNPIYSIYKGENVIFIDSFDLTISPNVKTSFMVLPHGLVESVIKKIETYSPLITILEQKIYQDMINSGQLERLIKRNNKTMKDKRNYLISSIQKSKLGPRFKFNNYDTGMNLLGIFDSQMNGTELTKLAFNNGVKIFEMTKFLLKPNNIMTKNAFVFGYAGLTIPEIESAVQNLENVWYKLK